MESSASSSAASHQLSSATAGSSTPTTTALPSPAVLVAGGVTAATLTVAAVLYLTSARSGAGVDDPRQRPDAKPGSGILSRLWGALGSRGEAEPRVCVHAHATARDAEPDRDWVAEEGADAEEDEAEVGEGEEGEGEEGEEEGGEEEEGGGGGVAWRHLLDAGSDDEDEVEVPADFKDPITLNVISDPVILAATGQVYDYASLKDWFRTGHRICPRSNIEVLDVQVVRVPWLRCRIRDWVLTHGSAAQRRDLRAAEGRPDAVERLARLHPALGGWVHAVRNDTGQRRGAALADVYEMLRQWEVAMAAPPEEALEMAAAAAAGEVAAAAAAANGTPTGVDNGNGDGNGDGNGNGNVNGDGGGEAATAVAADDEDTNAEPPLAGQQQQQQQQQQQGQGQGVEEAPVPPAAAAAAQEVVAVSAAAFAAALERLHKFVRGAVMDECVWLLRYGGPYLQGVAASILAYADTPAEVCWLAAVAAVPAASLAMSQNRYTSQAAARLLYNLARGGPVARRALVGAGAVTALISVLATDRQEYGYCRDRAAACLALLIRDPDGKSLLARYGLPSHLVAMVAAADTDRWEARDAATVLLKMGLGPDELRSLGLSAEALVSYWCCSRAWLEGRVDSPGQGYTAAERQARQAVAQLQAGTLTAATLAAYIADQDADLVLPPAPPDAGGGGADGADGAGVGGSYDGDDPWAPGAHDGSEAAAAWRAVEATARRQLEAAAATTLAQRQAEEEERRRRALELAAALGVDEDEDTEGEEGEEGEEGKEGEEEGEGEGGEEEEEGNEGEGGEDG